MEPLKPTAGQMIPHSEFNSNKLPDNFALSKMSKVHTAKELRRNLYQRQSQLAHHYLPQIEASANDGLEEASNDERSNAFFSGSGHRLSNSGICRSTRERDWLSLSATKVDST
jgi:hypothetical protein